MHSLSRLGMAMLCLLVISCKSNSIKLIDTNAKGEVDRQANLRFSFNKSMVTDSMLNTWIKKDYISFEPAIQGEYRWINTGELEFSPAVKYRPDTRYKIKFNPSIFSASPNTDLQFDEELDFHTPSLQMNDVNASWTSANESLTDAQAYLTINFNYKVKPKDILNLLDVTMDDRPAKFKMISNENTVSPVIALLDLKPADRSVPVKVQIRSGLGAVGSLNKTRVPLQAQLDIPSPYLITINKVEGTHESGRGMIKVYTSQPLAKQDLHPLINFSDNIKFTASVQDYGMLIESDAFRPESGYQFEIDPALKGAMGSYLRTSYTGNAAFGELAPDISFTNDKAVYLSKKGSGQVEVRIVNVPKVKITISRIYESNLLQVEQRGYEPNHEDDDDEYGYYNSGAGDVIYTEEIESRRLQGSDLGRVLNLNRFESMMPGIKGVYHVQVQSTEDYWVRASRLISFSDIGLIAKQGKSHLFVFANSISQSTSLGDVEVKVFGKNNQLVGKGRTHADGAVDIPLRSDLPQNFKPALIVARMGNDLNYMPFQATAVDLSRFEVGGKSSVIGMDAFIFPERDMYRPGEEMHAGILLRDKNRQNPGAIPVTVRINMPNGQVLANLRKTTNETGALELKHKFSNDVITGTYTVEVYSQSDVLLSTQNINVEEFVPDRLKLNISSAKSTLRPGESATVTIDAQNFIGTPAAGRKFQSVAQIKKKAFHPENFKDYSFELYGIDAPGELISEEGVTDANGKASFRVEVPSSLNDMGMLQATFYHTVFDETGRPVTRSQPIEIPTQAFFNGIKSDNNYYRPLNQPAFYKIVSVNSEGKAAGHPVRVMAILHQYKTVLARSGSYFRYETVEEDKVLENRTVTINGETNFSFTPRIPGDYEVRIYNEQSDSYINSKFYSYGSWGAGQSGFEVNREGNVDIAVDKAEHQKGDKLRLLFKAPFNGRMLVTMEREELIAYQYVDVKNKSAELILDLSKETVPNVFISATVFKPHGISDMPLTVAHGFTNVKVGDNSKKINVSIAAVDRSRSQMAQEITVNASPGAMVNLAVVDNGVLQVSDFKTPDPYAHFFQKRGLGVKPYDLYPLLFPEVRSRRSSGGDMYFSTSQRVNPIQAKRFQIMSWWSGLKQANSSGKVVFKLPIAAFNGELRMMAIAFKDDAFGGAAKTMTVADPIVVSTAMPRFITPGDTILVPVTLTNTTKTQGAGKASLQVKGPVKLLGNGMQDVSLIPGKETRVVFKLTASADIGLAQVDTKVNGLGAEFSEHIEIAVRPPSSLQKRTGSGVLIAGKNASLQMPVKDFIPSSAHYTVTAGKSPLVQQIKSLNYLLDYPYGCTEQTVSTAFPQLYFDDLASLAGKQQKDGKSVASYNVTEAIRKIKMRQLYNGGVTLWDNEGEAQWWTSIYAAHFLMEARKAGFEVENSLLNKLLGFITMRLQHRETINYYYNRDQNRKIVPREVIYSLYVLTLARQSQPALMNYYQSHQDQLTLDSRYLLAAAYAQAGDRSAYAKLLPASIASEVSEKETGGSFASPLRDKSLALNALLDADPSNAQVVDLSKMVAQELQQTEYLNTQEASFAFTALGKIARSQKNSNVSGKIVVGNKTVAQFKDQFRGTEKELGNSMINILSSGSGYLYYSWEAKGISSTGDFVEEDKFVSIRRNYYDRNGKRISGNSFRQNDLVVVELVLNKQYSGTISNMVITDLLPAGFEIENPRIREVQGMNWVKNESIPTASDIRDDRINLFVDAYQPVQRYYYMVRAVSPGVFRQGPVSADAMYNGAIHSYHGAGVVRISSTLPQ